MKRVGANAIVDSATQLRSSSEPLIRQAIEVYADCVAISQSLSRTLSIDYRRAGIEFPLTQLQKLCFWCYGIFGVFRIWGLEIPLTNLDKLDYHHLDVLVVALKSGHSIFYAFAQPRDLCRLKQAVTAQTNKLSIGPGLTGDNASFRILPLVPKRPPRKPK